MASKSLNCGKNRANWEERIFVQVSVTPKINESVEISHAPKSLLHSVIGQSVAVEDLITKIIV